MVSRAYGSYPSSIVGMYHSSDWQKPRMIVLYARPSLPRPEGMLPRIRNPARDKLPPRCIQTCVGLSLQRPQLRDAHPPRVLRYPVVIEPHRVWPVAVVRQREATSFMKDDLLPVSERRFRDMRRPSPCGGAGCGVWRAPDGETSGSMGPISATAARAPLRLLARLSSLQSPHRTHSLPHAPFLP